MSATILGYDREELERWPPDEVEALLYAASYAEMGIPVVEVLGGCVQQVHGVSDYYVLDWDNVKGGE